MSHVRYRMLSYELMLLEDALEAALKAENEVLVDHIRKKIQGLKLDN